MLRKLSIVMFLLVFVSSGAMLMAQDNTVSKYNHIQEEDARLAKIGIDYFGQGAFEKAAIFFERAIAIAEKENAPVPYIENLKVKLGTTYINLERFQEGRSLLKEVHGVDIPQ